MNTAHSTTRSQSTPRAQAAVVEETSRVGDDVAEARPEVNGYDLMAEDDVPRLNGRGATARPEAINANGVAVQADAQSDEAGSSDESSDLEGGSAKLRGWPRFEAWVERLAHKHSFIRKLTSRLFLPIAFHSGLTMKKLDPKRFTYVLPFRRFNRNFYDAMAGAALVANSEIAAGMYLFGELGGQWTVVCKRINYRFLRPCLGPAVYKVDPQEDVKTLMSSGKEFNIEMQLEIQQQVTGKHSYPRVGRCEVTFHCAPKGPEGNRGLRRRRRRRRR